MPEITFVLPHWLYWSGLVFFPLTSMYFFRRAQCSASSNLLSLPLAYFLLLLGGFVGVHRMYVRSTWALAFIAVFVGILTVNVEIRTARDKLSGAENAVSLQESKIQRAVKKSANAKERLSRHDNERNRNRYGQAQQQVAELSSNKNNLLQEAVEARQNYTRWNQTASIMGGLLLLMILVDALLLPGMVRRCRAQEGDALTRVFECPARGTDTAASRGREKFAFSRWIAKLNMTIGEFVAYWSIIAVFVYYYEVMVRYVFNSPTNWAHEGMFLMFGMQYLLAGGFCLHERAHVRVDVIYMHFSARGKVIADLVTSVFFFIFVLTFLISGWIFFYDSFSIKEVSFTEWGIQYYPIKFALPLGALLILLQGIARLAEDIHTLSGQSDPVITDSPTASPNRDTHGN